MKSAEANWLSDANKEVLIMGVHDQIFFSSKAEDFKGRLFGSRMTRAVPRGNPYYEVLEVSDYLAHRSYPSVTSRTGHSHETNNLREIDGMPGTQLASRSNAGRCII
jgi:hypothetical protein